MIDPYVLLTPVLLLAVFALVRFVGCFKKPSPSGPHLYAVPGDEKVFLWWDAGSQSSNVKRRTSPNDSYSLVAQLAAGVGVYTDRSLTNGTTYYYVVSEDYSGDESDNSNEVPATPAPIQFQQKGEQADASATVTDTVKSSVLPNVNKGNLIVVWIFYNSIAVMVSSVSDDAIPNSNTYAPAGGPTRGRGALAGWTQEIWYASNVNINGPQNLTVQALLTGSFPEVKAISAHEYSNASPGNPFDDPRDKQSGAADDGAAPVRPVSSGTATTSETELVFGAAIFSDVGGMPGPGFNQESSLRGHVTEDQRFPAGTVEATFANPAPGQSWIAQMATFR
jgi:hypothetical protein